MKAKFLAGIISAFFIFTLQSAVYAEFFSVSAGIPISYSLESSFIETGSNENKIKTDGLPSGLLIHANLPILVGLGYEFISQNFTGDVDSEEQNFKMETILYDVFYLFPFPIINFTVGLGLGTSTFTCEDSGTCDSTSSSITQYYAQLGFPIFGVVDIHAAYQKITGGDIEDINASSAKISPNATAISIGASLSF